MAGDNAVWFLCGGASEGWITQGTVSAGVGYNPPSALGDLAGFAGGWTDPESSALSSQFTVARFYCCQVTPNFAISPDVQYVIGPSLNPDIDHQVILGPRLRATF